MSHAAAPTTPAAASTEPDAASTDVDSRTKRVRAALDAVVAELVGLGVDARVADVGRGMLLAGVAPMAVVARLVAAGVAEATARDAVRRLAEARRAALVRHHGWQAAFAALAGVIGAAVTVLVAVHLWHGGRLRPGHAGAALAPIFAVWGVLAALVHTVGALTVPRIPRELRDDA